jgi:hypothetical protein
MSVPPATDANSFQPGQLGIRHLLGLMGLVSLILAVSSARLRSLQPLQAALVAWHWAVLLLVVGIAFFVSSRWRRRDKLAAGDLVLRAYSRSLTTPRSSVAKWLLTLLVLLDGIYISLAFVPMMSIPQTQGPWTRSDWIAFLVGNVVPQNAITEGLLWAWCLNHWLSNVYLVEVRQNGIITSAGYFAWEKMTGLRWSTIHTGSLIFSHRLHVVEIPIEPASRHSVGSAIQSLRSNSFNALPKV